MRSLPRVGQCVLGAGMAAALFFASVSAGMAQSAGHNVRTRPGHVYLLRGLIGIFSFGMDRLAEKLAPRGVNVEVYQHTSWPGIADQIIADYRANPHFGPIVLAGHSYGADAAMYIAERLNEAKVPVGLVITFDPTEHHVATANVRRVVNYYLSNSLFNKPITRGPGFRGSLANIDMKNAPDMSHVTIDKSDRIQHEAAARILSALGAASAPRKPKTVHKDSGKKPKIQAAPKARPLTSSQSGAAPRPAGAI